MKWGKKIAVLFLSATAVFLLFASCGMPGVPTGSDHGAVKATNYYQCWIGGTQTGVTCSNDAGGRYRVTWNTSNDWVAGKGWNPCNSANIQWTGGCTGCNYFGVYGWLSTPLTEYYIGRGGGSSAGTYSTSKGSYTLYSYNCNGPNITGNGNFVQFNCSGNGSSPINLAEHFQGWRNLGKQVTTQNYCIVASEAWSGSGSADVTVSEATGSQKSWTNIPTGMDAEVSTLAVDAAGTLYAGGAFLYAGGTKVNHVTVRTYSSWGSVGSGLPGWCEPIITVGTNTLYAATYDITVSPPIPRVMQYRYGAWTDLGAQMDRYTDVYALAYDSLTSSLYAGGSFRIVQGQQAYGIAKYNTKYRTWSVMTPQSGSGPAYVRAITLDKSGNVYAGCDVTFTASDGTANYIARWDGRSWYRLGTGTDGPVYSFAYDSAKNVLYAAGWFKKAGGKTVNLVAKYDCAGKTWSSLKGGLSGSYVNQLVLDKAGNLYAIGAFSSADGVSVNGLAMWNGTAWSAVGTGYNGGTTTIAYDAVNDRLYTGGGTLIYVYQ